MPSRAITKILSQRLAFDLHRVVIYCRTSTHTQEQLNSMTNQVSKLTQLVAENPMWTLCDIYLDFRSGSTIAGRTEFMRLLDDAANRKFDIVLCKSISRFGRNVTEALQMIKLLHQSGVHVIFEQENLDSSDPEHTLLISIMSSVSEAENEIRRQNVNWGIQRRLENGSSRLYSRPCYGYENDAAGELTINEQQADVVRLIFSMYLSGKSVVGIIASLYDLKIPSPTGKEKWSKRSIEVMLKNKKYTGDVVILKKYADTTKPVDSVSHITYLATASHPAIITGEQFSEVQAERARRSNIVVDENGSHRKNSKYSSKKAMQAGGESCEEFVFSQS